MQTVEPDNEETINEMWAQFCTKVRGYLDTRSRRERAIRLKAMISDANIHSQTTNNEMTSQLHIVGLMPKGGAANQAYSWALYYDMSAPRDKVI